MEHEEAELDDVDEDEDKDELVSLRADCDAASCLDAPRPCALPRRRRDLRLPRTRPIAVPPSRSA